jgi:hypothetical protein
MAQKAAPTKKTVTEDPRYVQALQSYETGLRAMQEHKFEKAKPHFQQVRTGPSKELIDRATVHLNICNQHLERPSASQFKTSEEHFDYAVSLMNVGDYVSAREWHASQSLEPLADGVMRMTLNVCIDRALESWIMSFGPFARVRAPESLARNIAGHFEEARARYA